MTCIPRYMRYITMERIELEAEKREVIGKNVRFLRRTGITPANLYGHGIESIPLQVNTKQLATTLAHMSMTDLIHLKISGTKTPRNVMVRQVQKNPTSDDVLHVDFYQVKMTEKIKADVPLVFTGEAPVLKRKNVSLIHLLDTLHVEGLPDHLPHNIEVEISSLEEPDQAIYVKDIPLSDDITLISDPEQMVVKAEEARRAIEVEEVVEAAEEEVAEGEEAAVEAEAAPAEEGKAESSAEEQ
jgi:large subunit ribosomal protein L25